jgi:hypothetical protein
LPQNEQYSSLPSSVRLLDSSVTADYLGVGAKKPPYVLVYNTPPAVGAKNYVPPKALYLKG